VLVLGKPQPHPQSVHPLLTVNPASVKMGDKGPGSSSASSSAVPPMGCAAVYVDSVKAMGESVGIANLNDEGAKVLAEDVTYRIRNILQDAMKFMEKAKRKKLSTQDFDNALKVKNIEVSRCVCI